MQQQRPWTCPPPHVLSRTAHGSWVWPRWAVALPPWTCFIATISSKNCLIGTIVSLQADITRHVLWPSIKHNIMRYLFTSSCCEYTLTQPCQSSHLARTTLQPLSIAAQSSIDKVNDQPIQQLSCYVTWRKQLHKYLHAFQDGRTFLLQRFTGHFHSQANTAKKGKNLQLLLQNKVW